MAVNPAIALGVRGIDLPDPLAQYGKVMAIQSAQQQNALAQRQMQQAEREQEATNALNRAYAEAYNPKTGDVDINRLRQSMATGGFGSKIPSVEKSIYEGREARTKSEESSTKLLDAKLKQSRQFLETLDPNDPNAAQAYIAWHEGNHADPVIGAALAARGVTADQARASIAQALQTPGGLARLINQSKLGVEKFMELNKPQLSTTDIGGQVVSRTFEPVTGQLTTIGTERKTMAPGEAERIRIAAGQLALSQQRLAWEKENPGYELQQTADGNIVGINKRTLQAVPVTLGNTPGEAAPSGQLLKGAPKSKDIAVSEQQAAYNISRVLNAAQEIAKVAEKDPSALAPGATEAAASSVGLSGTANLARSTNRQIVNGAQRDALDAILYLATGAAYNKEQLKGAIEAYMPAYTDSAEYREVKRKRMAKLIESAKVRAGKAWTPDLENALQSLTEPLSAASGKSSKSTRSAKPVAVSADEVDTDNPLLK